MNLISLYLGMFLLLTTLGELCANKVCFKSKTCIHNGVEKCAIDEQNKPRRFFDSCDLLEYNCLKGTDYKKTSRDKCNSLPPLDDSHGNKTPSKGNNTSDAQ